MLFIYHIVAIVAVLLPHYSTANKFNVSLSDLNTCEVYIIQSKGYTYADFFQLNTMKSNGKLKDDERFHLKLYVMTSMDAHILLSEVNNPRKTDRVYEIVLGAGSNSFSAIRVMMSRKRVATTLAPNLLSVFDPMPVEIIQKKDGLLMVNIPNYSEPHLNYTDKSPLNIRYISFSSYGLIAAKWYYDCRFDGYLEEMEMEAKPLSNEDRLTADILNVSEPELPPPNVTEILFAFRVRSVEFNQRSSILSTRLHLIMEWIDSRLKWNTSDYGGVDHIVQPLFKLWHPKINVDDGALDTFKQFNPFYSVRLLSNGTVRMLARNAEINSWCFDERKDWPNDNINCEILLALKDDNIKLTYDTSSPLTDQSINELSEWTLNKVSVWAVPRERTDSEFNTNDSRSLFLKGLGDELSLQLTISRNSMFYHCVFTAPALVSEGLILLAFFLDSYRRGGINLVVLVVTSLGLMFLALHAPPTTVPDIVTVYSILMKVATITYILHVISYWLVLFPPKFEPNEYIMKVVNNSVLRFMLAIRFMDSNDFIKAQEQPWQEVSKILNRLAFIGILITFICINFEI